MFWPLFLRGECFPVSGFFMAARDGGFAGFITVRFIYRGWRSPRHAIFPRDVRSGDEGAADLGGVPARYDAETQRLFGLDVARGENLHGTS